MSHSAPSTAAQDRPRPRLARLRHWLALQDRRHRLAVLIVRRLAAGVVTLLIVSILVFFATEVLPGNAAYAVLGHSATPAQVQRLEAELDLTGPLLPRYFKWIGGILRGDPGNSLVAGGTVSFASGSGVEKGGTVTVTSIVIPRLENSALLVLIAGLIGTLLGGALGIAAAARRDGWLDHVVSTTALAVTALPEFVVAIALVLIFSTYFFHLLPAVAVNGPGQSFLSDPSTLVLPVATLVMLVVPYITRMTRAAMVDALQSDYVEMANLKGLSRRRVLLMHALPNAVAPIVQVIGLNFLYLAGGIVVVEYMFNIDGIGAGLVGAVSDRDIPTVQFIVLLLSTFYIVVNIVTDIVVLAATPRRRLVR